MKTSCSVLSLQTSNSNQWRRTEVQDTPPMINQHMVSLALCEGRTPVHFLSSRHWARICHIAVNHQESFNPPRSTASCKLRQIYPDKPPADSCSPDLFLSSSKPSSLNKLTTCTTDSSFRTRIFSIFTLSSIYRSDILEVKLKIISDKRKRTFGHFNTELRKIFFFTCWK